MRHLFFSTDRVKMWVQLFVISAEFADWMTRFHKTYRTSAARHDAERQFYRNDAFLQNFSDNTIELAHNPFSDMHWETFRKTLLTTVRRVSNKIPKKFPPTYFAMYGGVDWEKRGAVTPVRQQGHCGSCWAFSATGAIESNLFVNTGKTTLLSPESLVDCDPYDRGCQGGSMETAFEYATSKGLCTEHDQPYREGHGICSCSPSVTIDDYVKVGRSEHDLTRALLVTPVSVSIEADHRVFQFYKSGVLRASHCGTDLDHGVLLVGYGHDKNDSYWRIKNSWGETWGERGYVRIARGYNTCGILNDASYPVGARRRGVAQTFNSSAWRRQTPEPPF